jgi:hypothetical protein
MTINFGLITEGPTDQVIIKSILSGYFGESNLVLNMIRPKKGQPGGWTEVFKYCKSSEFEEAFEANDYIGLAEKVHKMNLNATGREKW